MGAIVIGTRVVIAFVEAHLDAMVGVVESLGDDRVNTKPPLAGANSAFALVTHCVGVIDWWVGYQIAGRHVDRDRDAEFTASGTIDELRRAVQLAVARLRADCATVDVDEPINDRQRYPEHDQARAWTKGQALLHVLDEVAQHHGHLDLTVDLLRDRNVASTS